MPTYPLYVPLLPEAAQRVLGEPNAKSLVAYDIHLEEGFEPDRFVDIFDAGPVLTARIERSACVRYNETRAVREADGMAEAAAEPARRVDPATTTYLVAGNGAGGFRCILADLPGAPERQAPLSASERALLDVVPGDAVRCVPLHRRPDEDVEGADGDGFYTRDRFSAPSTHSSGAAR